MAEKRRRFAEGTTVAVEKTRDEIERLLAANKAGQCNIARDFVTRQAILTFRISERLVKVEVPAVPQPDPAKGDYDQKAFKEILPRRWWTMDRTARARWVVEYADQAERESWRRLLLVLKAKFEIIADGSSTPEREFLADILLPDGQTIHEALAPKLRDSYLSGDMPALLPAKGETGR